MRHYLLFFLAFGLLSLWGCGKKESSGDKTAPLVGGRADEVAPIDCQRYPLGQSIAVYYHISDETALASYRVDVHNNFDHHVHGISMTNCGQSGLTSVAYPFEFDSTVNLMSGTKSLDVRMTIPIPYVPAPETHDVGDYHFRLTVTDAAGNTTVKAVPIKIVGINGNE